MNRLVPETRSALAQPVNKFHPEGGKLKIQMSGKGEVEIIGNRPGLKALSDICAALSESVGEDGNHYHLMDIDAFWGTEQGSIPLIIYGEDL
jgi:hypothetical protein